MHFFPPQFINHQTPPHQNLSHNKLHLEGAIIVCNMLICNYLVKSIKLSGKRMERFGAPTLLCFSTVEN